MQHTIQDFNFWEKNMYINVSIQNVITTKSLGWEDGKNLRHS